MMSLLVSGLTFLSLTFAQSGQKPVNLKCPDHGTMIDYTSEINKERQVFCQVKRDGKMLKHGPELVYNSEGRLIKKAFYDHGFATDSESAQKKKEQNFVAQMSVEDTLKKITSTIINHIVSPENNFCDITPIKRHNFILSGMPYEAKYQFSKDCSLEGKLLFDFDRPLKRKLTVSGIDKYTSLSLDYLLTKKGQDGKILVNLIISDAKLLSGQKDRIYFNADINLSVSPDSLVSSNGKLGITITRSRVNITDLNEYPASYTLNL